MNDFASVQANATDDGSDTTIQYTGGSVVLIGVQVANLHEDGVGGLTKDPLVAKRLRRCGRALVLMLSKKTQCR